MKHIAGIFSFTRTNVTCVFEETVSTQRTYWWDGNSSQRSRGLGDGDEEFLEKPEAVSSSARVKRREKSSKVSAAM